jgi:hypothetical protein
MLKSEFIHNVNKAPYVLLRRGWFCPPALAKIRDAAGAGRNGRRLPSPSSFSSSPSRHAFKQSTQSRRVPLAPPARRFRSVPMSTSEPPLRRRHRPSRQRAGTPPPRTAVISSPMIERRDRPRRLPPKKVSLTPSPSLAPKLDAKIRSSRRFVGPAE